VCVPGYAKKVRAVPVWLKRQPYAEYGITQYETGDYEGDHLIPLSLEALISFVRRSAKALRVRDSGELQILG